MSGLSKVLVINLGLNSLFIFPYVVADNQDYNNSVCLLACLLAYLLFFWDRVLLCNPGHPGTCSVDQTGLCLPECLD